MSSPLMYIAHRSSICMLLSLTDGYADLADLAAADDAQRCRLADSVRREGALELVRVADRVAAEADDDIADHDAALLCRGTGGDPCDEQAALLSRRFLERSRQGHRLAGEAEEGALQFTVREERGDDRFCRGGRNRQTAHPADAGAIQAEHPPLDVDE